MNYSNHLAAAALAVAIGWGRPCAAQMLPNSMVGGMDAAAMKAVGPAVQAVLADGKAGAVQPWKSADRHGRVRLLGADPKQPACRRVRMSAIVDGVEKRGYIFRYCSDAQGRWRIAG